VKGASTQAKGASKEGFIAHLLLLGVRGIWGISFLLVLPKLLVLKDCNVKCCLFISICYV
jgi:hypothetical protein